MNLDKNSTQGRLFSFISSGFSVDEYDSIRKVIMINVFFLVGIVAFFSFSIFNLFLTSNYIVALIDVLALAIFLFSYLDLKKNKNLYRSSIIGATALILFMVMFTYFNHNHSFGLIWTIFVPIFCISLFGSKIGFKISLIYYALLLPILLSGVFNWHEETWDIISFIRFFFASLSLVAVIYITENSFEKISHKLKKLTNVDPLTNAYNRRKIDEIINFKFTDYERYKTKLCIAILDIDDFKKINDEYGHAAGDEVLKEVVKILKESSRKSDIVGRWGGEEFILIMQNIDLQDSVAHLNRLKDNISSHKFSIDTQVTCSIGVCKADAQRDTIDKLFRCADNSLYDAKNNGKNRTSFTELTA